VPLFWNADARADVIADPLPAGARLEAGEDVKAALEPRGKAVGDLDRFMERMIVGQDAVNGLLVAI
jgi:hypothetical protein